MKKVITLRNFQEGFSMSLNRFLMCEEEFLWMTHCKMHFNKLKRNKKLKKAVKIPLPGSCSSCEITQCEIILISSNRTIFLFTSNIS